MPPLKATLSLAQPRDALELDELWSFVRHRRREVIWLWLALCGRTRQIVAYALGTRDDATAHFLWGRIPLACRQSRLYTDHLESYSNALPVDCHEARSPKRGSTNHIERFNSTLRQRIGRFVRETLSFSKSVQMHEIALHLFLHQYNLACSPHRATTLKSDN